MRHPVIGALVAALGAACAGADPDAPSPSGAPSVTLLQPLDGSTVCGTPLQVAVRVENYVLVEFGPEVAVPGEGHVDFALNGQNVWMTYEPAFEIPEVDPGLYELEAILVDGTHHAIEPEVSDLVRITVDPQVCPTR